MLVPRIPDHGDHGFLAGKKGEAGGFLTLAQQVGGVRSGVWQETNPDYLFVIS